MQVAVKNISLTEIDVDAVAVHVFEGEGKLGESAVQVDEAMGGAVRSLLENGDIQGQLGETAVLYPAGALKARRVVVAGMGKPESVTPERCRQASARAARKARQKGAQSIAMPLMHTALDGQTPGLMAQATVEGILMGTYRAKHHQSVPKTKRPLNEVSLVVSGEAPTEEIDRAVARGQIFADAVCTARDLVNQPGNFMTPQALSEVASAIAVKEGLSCQVLGEEELADLKMGAFLSVAKGSVEAPRFIILEHRGRREEGERGPEPPLVLVGKGITFDSGGISLKPRDRMEEMKTDMAGAAVVMAVLQAVSRLALPIHVVALAPACENLPSGSANKPGDVVTAMNGKTIEVVNTDAEGRLILADALCYAARYKPEAVIDVATLTGACVIALGEDVAAGIFSTHDDLWEGLSTAGEFNGEQVWRLPLYEAYREKIKSDVADMKNTGGRYGGVGTSAVFLQEFVSYPWAHFDIAGMSLGKNDSAYVPKGATGFGVRTLLSFLMSRTS
jgi:leucyl aminopeptidase